MEKYTYIPFGCDCNSKCVCSLCNLKAIDCKYAGCKNCDKITGHLGCMYK